MTIEELLNKVTADTSEKPYITLEDIQDVVDEQKTALRNKTSTIR